jgi:MoxR-like ATPase
MAGRVYVTADDVKGLIGPVFGHRVLLSSPAALSAATVERVLDKALAAVPVPTSVRG